MQVSTLEQGESWSAVLFATPTVVTFGYTVHLQYGGGLHLPLVDRLERIQRSLGNRRLIATPLSNRLLSPSTLTGKGDLIRVPKCVLVN